MSRLISAGAVAIALGLLAGGCGTSTSANGRSPGGASGSTGTPNSHVPPATTTSQPAASAFTSWCHLKVGGHWEPSLPEAFYTVGPAAFDGLRIPKRDTLQAWRVGEVTLIEVSKLVDSRVPLLETGAVALVARGISSAALGCSAFRGRI